MKWGFKLTGDVTHNNGTRGRRVNAERVMNDLRDQTLVNLSDLFLELIIRPILRLQSKEEVHNQ